MNYADFDPALIRERNEGLRREVQRLRLERRLRAKAEPRPGVRWAALLRSATLLARSPLRLLRRGRWAGPQA